MANISNVFVLQYYYGGKFVTSPKFSYIGGNSEKLQVDPYTLCYWDIIGNANNFGYEHDPWVYYRVPGVEFNSDALVLVNDDNTVRRCLVFLNSMGIVDQQSNYECSEKSIEVGEFIENINELVEIDAGNTLDVEDVTVVDDLGLTKGLGAEVSRGVEDTGEAVDTGRAEDTGPEDIEGVEDTRGAKNTGAEDTGGVEDTRGSVEEELQNGEDDFIVSVEVSYDLDKEVEEIRDKLRKTRHRRVSDGSEDEEQIDVEIQGHAFVGNDTLVEEGLHEDNGKLEGNEGDYLCSYDPGEYGDSDEDREDKIYGSFKVRKYAIAKGLALRYLKSEPNRLRVRCRDGCPWLLFASFDRSVECPVVKTYNHVYTCFRANKNMLLTYKHIQKVFKEKILLDPKMKTATLVTMVRHELWASASYDMCQRAKKVILRESRGSYVEEYANLWGYAVELMYRNLGSTVSIQVYRDNDNNVVFHRMYSVTQGELLVVVGRDGNNQMFPVAWAVVEGECKESWNWFLTELMDDLNHPKGEGLTLMSDQQKKLEEMGQGSTNDLLGISTKHWSRAYFTGTSKCDVLDNNLEEAFSGWILDARCYPIISMMEEIRKKVMRRMHVKKIWATKWPTEISPVAKQKLEKNIDHSSQCRLVWNGHGGFEVTQGEDQHIVDVERLTCTFREWELTGIPCCHSICAMFHYSKDPHNYIAEWYSKKTFLASYSNVLHPVRRKQFWPKSDDPIQPPKLKAMPEIAKKKRTKDKDEPIKSKYGKFSRE
ncbi:hypothetical protein V6N12_031002 [Hibiscus sabdariffa]|uniref:Zinc finger PMZ-type domain-containing protein n=1 Tax=Hibiscus sabdariffa TaxID=183260 RepID=A0ABR2E7P9_9ROSI